MACLVLPSRRVITSGTCLAMSLSAGHIAAFWSSVRFGSSTATEQLRTALATN